VRELLKQPAFWFSVTNEAIYFSQAGLADFGLELHALSVKQAPAIAFNWYNYGVTLHRLGKTEDAIICYSRAIELDNACTLAWVNRGWIHIEHRRPAEAERDWRSAIRNDPNHEAARMVAILLQAGPVPEEVRNGQLEELRSRSGTLKYSF
jgi:tetratricopeptide (TPR) repeat protein